MRRDLSDTPLGLHGTWRTWDPRDRCTTGARLIIGGVTTRFQLCPLEARSATTVSVLATGRDLNRELHPWHELIEGIVVRPGDECRYERILAHANAKAELNKLEGA